MLASVSIDSLNCTIPWKVTFVINFLLDAAAEESLIDTKEKEIINFGRLYIKKDILTEKFIFLYTILMKQSYNSKQK